VQKVFGKLICLTF